QASVRQRNVKGFEYLASYTLGKARANQLGYYGSGGQTAPEGTYWMNAYQPEWNYGPAFFDVRHNFVLSANYELPFGRERKWGNSGVGIARMPGYNNIDTVLAKRFKAGGDRYFEFRAEAFNLLNRVNFGPPARDINAPNTFGTITTTVGAPRTMELVLKFFF